MKHIIMICLLATAAYAGDYWTSLSIRSPKIGNQTDWEVCLGGKSKHSSFEFTEERQNGIRYSGSDLQYFYDGFQWQWFKKEDRNIDFTEARWSTAFNKIKGLHYGGSLRNDMILKRNKYLGFAKYKRASITAEAYHNAVDYYSYSLKYQGKIIKGLSPLVIYKNVNGETWYQMKIIYRFQVGGN